MKNPAWKKFERRVATFFGGMRNPLSGQMSRHTAGDMIHPSIYVECKQRKSHAVIRVWDDAAKKAKTERKIPVVALSEKNRPGFWILVKSTDFLPIAIEMSVKHRSEDGKETD